MQSLMVKLSAARGFEIENVDGVYFLKRRANVDVDSQVLIYKPRFRTARYLSDLVSTLTAATPLVKREVRNPIAQGELTQTTQDNSSPTSANQFLDRSDGDQIVLRVPSSDFDKVKKLLADLDTPSGEILLKAAVYEVGGMKGQGGALKVVAGLLKGKLSIAAGAAPVGQESIHYASGNLDLILSALDTDSRFKSISRPMVRVRSGSLATFSVGQDVPVLGQATLDRNGNPVQSVDYKQSGVILKVTPDVHDDTVDLDIQQELSNFVPTANGVNNSPTLQKRSIQSKLSVKPGEVVTFAGLTQSQNDSSSSGLFGFHFTHQDNQSDSEILVFLEVEKI